MQAIGWQPLRAPDGAPLHYECAAGFNIRWLMRAIVRLKVRRFFLARNFAGWAIGRLRLLCRAKTRQWLAMAHPIAIALTSALIRAESR